MVRISFQAQPISLYENRTSYEENHACLYLPPIQLLSLPPYEMSKHFSIHLSLSYYLTPGFQRGYRIGAPPLQPQNYDLPESGKEM